MATIGDWSNMEGYEMVHGQEGAGSHGVVGIKIYVRTDDETKKRLEALRQQDVQDRASGKRDHRLTPYERENGIWRRLGDEAERIRTEQMLRLDPETAARAAKTKGEFEKAFIDAGLGPIFMEPIPNEYWGEKDPYGKIDPWFNVATPIGFIKIGWRKRVINIDWARTILRTLIEAPYRHETAPSLPSGEELFPTIVKDGETTTLGESYVHAYGYEKATKYLKVMAEWKARSA